jgi:S-adenosylmethionine:tRNA ribosyltransferase-isomerase
MRSYNRRAVRIDDFDFDLPKNLIAQFPAADRTASRLLHLDGASGRFFDRQFCDLANFVRPGDVVVMNDTRVIKARLIGTKASGGRIGVLIERILDDQHALVQIRASKPPRVGTRLDLPGDVIAEVLARDAEVYRLRFESRTNLALYLEHFGSVPLPPYIEHAPDTLDAERYQTIYARKPGAVAAPTAGLHFDEKILVHLREQGVALAYLTLHVGAGTFQPVRTRELSNHHMHSEWFEVPQQTVAAIDAARSRGGRVLAVGTTSMRALESAAASGTLHAGAAETRLFILPGYRFRIVDRLLTNFHLPKSTLLMLVSAFAGMDNLRRAYRHAIDTGYRFFSYGDAMLIERQENYER